MGSAQSLTGTTIIMDHVATMMRYGALPAVMSHLPSTDRTMKLPALRILGSMVARNGKYTTMSNKAGSRRYSSPYKDTRTIQILQ
jgi:hypothetical protein